MSLQIAKKLKQHGAAKMCAVNEHKSEWVSYFKFFICLKLLNTDNSKRISPDTGWDGGDSCSWAWHESDWWGDITEAAIWRPSQGIEKFSFSSTRTRSCSYNIKMAIPKLKWAIYTPRFSRAVPFVAIYSSKPRSCLRAVARVYL